MADTREIVGWFYKNGRRIPIKQKSGLSKDGKTTARTPARVEHDNVMDFYKFAKTQGEPVHPDIIMRVAEKRVDLTAKNKETIRKNASKSQDKYITDKVGANGYKYKSVDYDTSGGHVHKDVETKGEARQFLRRNNVLKVKQRMK